MPTSLTQSSALWLLFILFVLESIAFGLIMAYWDFVLIDEMSNPEHIRDHISQMSATQREVHAWTTATLDVAYPLTYGPLFAGLALRRFIPIFAIPALMVIPIDLIEGLVQILVLTGHYQWLWLKAYLTPLKLLFFAAALMIAIASLMKIGHRQAKPND